MPQSFITQEAKQLKDIQRYLVGTRVQKKISQETIARAIGKSRSTYTEKENNMGKMSLEEFLSTLNILGLHLEIYERSEP